MSSSLSAPERSEGAGLNAPLGISLPTNFGLLLGILLFSLLGGELLQRTNQVNALTRMDEMAAQVVLRIHERMNLYHYGLRGLAASIQAVGVDQFSRENFRRYSRSRDIAKEFPGARGFGVIRMVPASETRAFIEAARHDGRPAFSLRELGPNQGARWIIQYIDPEANNVGAEGVDIASETIRRAAVERTIETGMPTLSQPVTLVQADGDKEAGFLLMSPNYRPNMPLGTPEERRAAAFQVTYCALVISEVLAKVDLYAQELAFELDSIQPDGREKRFFTTANSGPSGNTLSISHPIDLFGVEWKLTAHATPVFFSRLNHFSPILLGFILFSILSGMLLLGNFYILARQRRAQLLAGQLKLAAIVESSNDAIIGKSTQGIVSSWNQAAEEMFGYSAAEAIGQSIASLIVPVDLQDEEQGILARIKRGEKVANFVTRRHRKDGREIEVSVSVSPIINAEGAIIGAAKTVHDVTEQQLAARQISELNVTLEQRVVERTAQLEEARKALHTILDVMPSMVAYWDKDCINRFANRAYLEWFGISPDELHGKHIRQLLGETLYQRNLPHITQALQGKAQLFERDIPRPDGSGIRHSIAHYLPNLSEDSVEGFYVIVHDITEAIDSRNQLQQAREQQLRMDRLASLGLMVAGVAHELNTPLGAAMLAMDKLAEELVQFKSAMDSGLRKSDVARFASHCDAGLAMASRYLSRSAEIIRQFKQVASDRAGAERRVFVANDVIRDVIHLMDGLFKKHGVKIELDLHATIELDSYPGIVGQVLQNLVENALVHAFDGHFAGTIRIAMQAAREGEALLLTITDNGKGIPEAIREQVWDPFFTTRRGEGGTGLGLHIVQRLVTEVLGGSIVLSIPSNGNGCEFVVSIPCHAPATDTV